MIKTGLVRSLAVFVLPVSGHGNQIDFGTDGKFSHAAGDLVTVKAGEADIDQHNLGLQLRGGFEARKAVVGRVDFVPGASQERSDRGHQVLVVIDQEDATCRVICRRGCVCGAY